MKTKRIETDNEIAKRGRTIILKKKSTPDAAKWVKWLEDNCLASAGPYPNICGMRNIYWGRQSLIVKSGAYIYLIAPRDDGRKMPWE
ncbi:MAG: hypothetical protein ACI4CE_07345 [Methanomethylophilus alvi]